MKIYHYNAETFEYEISSDAPICPVTGENMLPAFSTEIKPPTTRKTHVAKFTDGEWKTEKK